MTPRPKRLSPQQWRMQRAGAMKKIAEGRYSPKRLAERARRKGIEKVTALDALAEDLGTNKFRMTELIGRDIRNVSVLIRGGASAPETVKLTGYTAEFVDLARRVSFGQKARREAMRPSSYEVGMGNVSAKTPQSPKKVHSNKGRGPRAGTIDGMVEPRHRAGGWVPAERGSSLP